MNRSSAPPKFHPDWIEVAEMARIVADLIMGDVPGTTRLSLKELRRGRVVTEEYELPGEGRISTESRREDLERWEYRQAFQRDKEKGSRLE